MTDLATTADYRAFLTDIKDRVRRAQLSASLSVNQELIVLYWGIGRDILDRQAAQGWGSKVVRQLAHDLRTAFPEMKGFSERNLLFMRQFAEAWPDEDMVKRLVSLLPWGHVIRLMQKLDGVVEVTNPDEPLIHTHCFLDSPRRFRSEALASLLRRMGVCEQRGGGSDRPRGPRRLPEAHEVRPLLGLEAAPTWGWSVICRLFDRHWTASRRGASPLSVITGHFLFDGYLMDAPRRAILAATVEVY